MEREIDTEKKARKDRKRKWGIFIDKLDLKRDWERINVDRYIVIERRQWMPFLMHPS